MLPQEYLDYRRSIVSDTMGGTVPPPGAATPALSEAEIKKEYNRNMEFSKGNQAQIQKKLQKGFEPFHAEFATSKAAGKVDIKTETKKAMWRSVVNALTRTYVELGEAIGKLDPLDKELVLLGTFLQDTVNSLGGFTVSFLHGPIKVAKTAIVKTIVRVANAKKYDIASNKDLVRGTLAAKDQRSLDACLAELRGIVKGEFGLCYIKQEETKVTDLDNAAGYSGWNFGIVFYGIAYAAEMQLNTEAMMYGKMSPKEFVRDVGDSPEQYRQRTLTMGFPGGLGHAFYEIYDRFDRSSDESKQAAALSKKYYALCRTVEGTPTRQKPLLHKIAALNQELERFGELMYETKHKGMLDVWLHAGGPLPQKYANMMTKAGLKKNETHGWNLSK